MQARQQGNSSEDNWVATQFISRSTAQPSSYDLPIFVNVTYKFITCNPKKKFVERLTMSSSDHDSCAVNSIADETVSRMNDPTNEEIGYYKTYSFWGRGSHNYWRGFLIFISWYIVLVWSACTNCWSVGIGAGYIKLFLHRNATNHLRDHSTRLCGCTRRHCSFSFHQIFRST